MPVVFRPPANPSGGILDFDGSTLIIEFEKPRFFRDPDIVQIDIPLDWMYWSMRFAPTSGRCWLPTY